MKNTSDQAITIGALRIEAGAEIPAEFAGRRSLIKMFGADPTPEPEPAPVKPEPVKPAGGPPGGPPPAKK